jgi:hypothetical protein
MNLLECLYAATQRTIILPTILLRRYLTSYGYGSFVNSGLSQFHGPTFETYPFSHPTMIYVVLQITSKLTEIDN